MSYSFSLQVRQDGGTIAADVAAKGIETIEKLSGPVRPEMDEHIKAIAGAVEDIVASGALGDEALVNVNISGHAEPGHKKREGWSQDTISISLSQVQEPA
jgi:hypothetical protein